MHYEDWPYLSDRGSICFSFACMRVKISGSCCWQKLLTRWYVLHPLPHRRRRPAQDRHSHFQPCCSPQKSPHSQSRLRPRWQKKYSHHQKSYLPKTLPKLEIDEREKQILREKLKLKKQRKAKCTVLCVSLLLLTMCVTLVGTMLSFGSKYQVKMEWSEFWKKF